MDESEQYIEKQTKHFLEKIKDKSKWNGNIDPICYSLTDFQEQILPENNKLELEWKRRILMEYTPRGNVIMYYDIFKHAFAYASDQNIPYSILNACAMKYVITFRCIDFFVDSTILPDISPFSLLQKDAESKKKENMESKKKDLGISFSNAPFAKLKTYSSTTKIEFEFNEKKTNIGDMIKYSNNFRHLGKISNVSFLIKPKASNNMNMNSSLDILPSFDYLSYKKSLLHQRTL